MIGKFLGSPFFQAEAIHDTLQEVVPVDMTSIWETQQLLSLELDMFELHCICFVLQNELSSSFEPWLLVVT